MKIVAHCLVKNEENFIWYAINSVINYVDEIMVWDHGSVDNTASIIRSIRSEKVKFKKTEGEISQIRQEMLNNTMADWILILDGDEIWWEQVIKNLTTKLVTLLKIENSRYDVIVVPNYMLVGDIYHYQEKSAGKYKIADRVGHYNIRAIRKTPELHVEGVYPNEAYVTGDGTPVQNLPKEKILFLDEPYFHASFLPRSSKSNKKVKREIGENFPLDFYYPEVFFRPKPPNVISLWRPLRGFGFVGSLFINYLKHAKRRIFHR